MKIREWGVYTNDWLDAFIQQERDHCPRKYPPNHWSASLWCHNNLVCITALLWTWLCANCNYVTVSTYRATSDPTTNRQPRARVAFKFLNDCRIFSHIAGFIRRIREVKLFDYFVSFLPSSARFNSWPKTELFKLSFYSCTTTRPPSSPIATIAPRRLSSAWPSRILIWHRNETRNLAITVWLGIAPVNKLQSPCKPGLHVRCLPLVCYFFIYILQILRGTRHIAVTIRIYSICYSAAGMSKGAHP